MVELELPQDYVDFLEELVEVGVEFVLVGGWAVAAHGHGRATDDLDVLVRATPENAQKVYKALERFGAPIDQHGITAGLFAERGYGYRMGRKPVLIEILTTIDGVDFDDAATNPLLLDMSGVTIPVIGRRALLANKTASGRAKDLADVEALAGEP